MRKDATSNVIQILYSNFNFDNIVLKDNNPDHQTNNYNDNPSLGPSIVSAEQLRSSKYPIRRKKEYDASPFKDSLSEFRFKVAEILTKYYSVNITNLIHEVASSGQIEINFIHSTLTKTADNVQVYKDVVRNVATEYNKVADFKPKPIFNENDL